MLVMLVHRAGDAWEVWAPAKLNLMFEVIGRRGDGFHEIETLMAPISLFDRLRVQSDPTGKIDFRVRRGAGIRPIAAESPDEIPTGDDNLAVRAVRLLRDRSGVSLGARIDLDKHIPSAAGLGGGSSDAAAALVAARAAWSLEDAWPDQRLSVLASELGSDVPFFLARGSAVCRGRGELVEAARDLPRMEVVIVRPPEGLATADVYSQCRPAESPRRAAPLIEAIRRGNFRETGRLLFNRLESAAERLTESIETLRMEFEKLDLFGQQMTGSGSAYFGLCRDARHARRAASLLYSRNVGRVFAAHTLH